MTEGTSQLERTWERRRARQAFWLAVGKRLFSWRILRVKNGHYYSPIPSIKELRRESARIFDTSQRELEGVDVNVAGQLELLTELAAFYADQPFGEIPCDGLRYFFDNIWYGRADGLFLHAMLRRFRPRRVVEIGSGFSSAVMLDTNDRFLDGAVHLTFIEPDSRRLRALLKDGDRNSFEIIERRIQHIDSAIVTGLGPNDILFVDSSHVSKVGSDVNHILFELLPALASGVLIHFHDVLYPFEYPQEWFELGFSWNEPYMLRAFLQYNTRFKMRLWNDFLMKFHSDALAKLMPLCRERPEFGVGGSLWLQKV
jgi:predicted O-methyltransferase YrrM